MLALALGMFAGVLRQGPELRIDRPRVDVDERCFDE